MVGSPIFHHKPPEPGYIDVVQQTQNVTPKYNGVEGWGKRNRDAEAVVGAKVFVVGHGSSETIRPSDVSVTPFESASEQWAGGDAAAGGWLAAMRAMAIEWRWLQLATDCKW